jgi:2-dehydropantoate 2-reductase
MTPNICIAGVGAIGGWIAANLAAQGHRVTALARNETLRAIQKHGLTLATPAGVHTHRIEATDDAVSLGMQDLVVIAVKSQALPRLAPQLPPLIGPHTTVLTAMNGVPWWFLPDQSLHSVDPGGAIAAAIPRQQVLGCVVHASCSTDAPGRVRHHFGNKLIVGEPGGGDSPRTQATCALLAAAGFETVASPDIRHDVWFKLWGNMTVNPISAITGATTDRILGDPLVVDFVSRVMREARAVGTALGIPIAQEPEDRHAVTRKLGAFKTSMLQDVEAGRPVELDALVGAVHELGRIVGVPTPDTGALLGLARLHAQVRGLYPPG